METWTTPGAGYAALYRKKGFIEVGNGNRLGEN